MSENIRKKFLERLDAPPDPPLEATRKFLLGYCADKISMEEIEADVARMVQIDGTRTLMAGLVGMEALLADFPTEPGTLENLVAWEVGWVLDDPSDEGVKRWLHELAQMLREHLGDQAPPSP